jgi:hypothetical protein
MLRHIRSKLANRAPAAAGRAAGGFLRRPDGAAAIEFALAALPFLAFIFAISEMVIVFFANWTLETAAFDSARCTPPAATETIKWQVVFSYLQASISQFGCEHGVPVDVKTYTSLVAINDALPVVIGQPDTSIMSFSRRGQLHRGLAALLTTANLRVAAWKRQSEHRQSPLVVTGIFRNERSGHETTQSAHPEKPWPLRPRPARRLRSNLPL